MGQQQPRGILAPIDDALQTALPEFADCGADVMNGRRVRYLWGLVVAAVLALAVPARADTLVEAKRLNSEVVRLYEEGQYADAIPLAERSLAIREKALGPDHPDVATALNNLAELYESQGRYAEAEPLYKRSLAIREKALGPDHPDVGHVPQQPGRAVPEPRAATPRPSRSTSASLAIREKALGPDHPDVATSLNNLAALYQSQGRYAEAEPLYKRALAIRRRRSGPTTPMSPRRSTTWPGCTRARAATPRPSRSTSARSRSARRHWGPTTPMSPPPSTTWQCCTKPGPLRRGRAALQALAHDLRRRRWGPTTRDVATRAQQPGRAVPSPGPLRRGRAALQALARDPREGAGARPPGCRHVPQQPGRAVPGPGPLRRGRAALQALARDLGEVAARPVRLSPAAKPSGLTEIDTMPGMTATCSP